MTYLEYCKKNQYSPNQTRSQAFTMGAQSRQAEIDELRERVKELELINFDSELHFGAAKEHIDELQKRIDDASEILSQMKHNVAYKALDILKGTKND